MSTENTPKARYTLRISADSGYKSTTEGECTPHQYSMAVAALMGALPATQELMNQREYLLEALANLVSALDKTTWSSWQSTARFDEQLQVARELLDVVGEQV